jgi:hypothetical protein
MSFKFVIYLFIACTSAWGSSFASLKYSFADFKACGDILFNVSGMVFTIMGIWIAFLYPNALSRLANPSKIEVADFSETLGETRRLEAIVGSILKSGVVAISLVLMNFGAMMFRNTNFLLTNISHIKSIAFGVLIMLLYIQLEAVVSVAYANITFLNDLHSRRTSKQTDLDV